MIRFWKWLKMTKKINKTFVNCFINWSINNARQYWKNVFLFVLWRRSCSVYRNKMFHLKKSALKRNSKWKRFFNHVRLSIETKKKNLIETTDMLRRMKKQNKNWFDDRHDTKNKQINKKFYFFAWHSARKK